MSNDVTNELIAQILRNLQKGQKDLLDGQKDIYARLGSIEHKMAGSIMDDARQNMELDTIKSRISRLEKRTDIIDGDEPVQ